MVIATLGLTLFVAACDSKYQVTDRTEKQVLNYGMSGTHTEVHYVLSYAGRRIDAVCDLETIGPGDRASSCELQPHKSYQCMPWQSGEKSPSPPTGLKCRDNEGFSVYLALGKSQ